MRTIIPENYNNLDDNEKLRIAWLKTIEREVKRKSAYFWGYFLTLHDCTDKEGIKIQCVDIDDDGDMYYIKEQQERVYDDEWTLDEAIKLGMHIREHESVKVAKDMWDKPLDVGNIVVFKRENDMVKAKIESIKLGKNDESTRIYLTDFEMASSYYSPIIVKNIVSYKHPNTLTLL